MPTTLEALRQQVSELCGDWNSLALGGTASTTSGAGNAGGTTAVDSALSTEDDDHFNDDYFLLMTSGTDDGNFRPVSDFTGSTGTITVGRAFSAQIASGVTYELHRYRPSDYTLALNATARRLWPRMYRRYTWEDRVVDDLLLNSSFETDIAAANWVSSGSPTITYNTTLFMHGRSINIVAGGSAGSVYQDITINIKELLGKTIIFGMMVYATAANTVRIRVSYDGGSTFTNHDYHDANDEWKLQEITASIPTTATGLRVVCEVAASGTGRFDHGFLVVNGLERKRYDVDSSMLILDKLSVADFNKNPRYAGYEPWPWFHLEGNPNNDSGPSGLTGLQVVLDRKPDSKWRMKMEGRRLFTALAADADTIEIDSPQTTPLVYQAAIILLENQLANTGGRGNEEIIARLTTLKAEWLRIEKDKSLWTPSALPQVRQKMWY